MRSSRWERSVLRDRSLVIITRRGRGTLLGSRGRGRHGLVRSTSEDRLDVHAQLVLGQLDEHRRHAGGLDALDQAVEGLDGRVDELVQDVPAGTASGRTAEVHHAQLLDVGQALPDGIRRRSDRTRESLAERLDGFRRQLEHHQCDALRVQLSEGLGLGVGRLGFGQTYGFDTGGLSQTVLPETFGRSQEVGLLASGPCLQLALVGVGRLHATQGHSSGLGLLTFALA